MLRPYYHSLMFIILYYILTLPFLSVFRRVYTLKPRSYSSDVGAKTNCCYKFNKQLFVTSFSDISVVTAVTSLAEMI